MSQTGSLHSRLSIAAVAVGAALALATATPAASTVLPVRPLGPVSTLGSLSALGSVSKARSAARSTEPRQVEVQLLTFNDFHGQLETGGPITTGYQLNADGSVVLDSHGQPIPDTVEAGGAAYLAANLAAARKNHKYSITAAAGDLIGSSPLVSGAFHDEPSIETLGDLGLEVSAVGNLEFNEGATELLRKQYGLCLSDGDGADNQNSCPGDHSFEGASFRYLAANIVRKTSGRTLFPPYWIKDFGDGIRIAFIGLTLEETSTLAAKANVAGLVFKNEVATANALVPQIQKQGVQSIVVLVHQGGTPDYKAGTKDPVSAPPPANFRCDKNAGLDPNSGIIPIAQKLSPAIDLIVSAHTHMPYVCNIPDPLGRRRLVTSAASFGRLFTDIRLVYDRHTGNMIRAKGSATNKIVSRTVTPEPRVAALVADYESLAAPIANRVIGKIAVSLPNTASAAGEIQLGDLITDAQAADPSVAGSGAPDVAFMNPDDIVAGGLTAAGDVSFGQALAMQPYKIPLVSMSLNGQQIVDLLNQQWTGANAGASRMILQVSSGFSYRWQNLPSGPVLDESSVMIKGVPLVKSQLYRVVANNLLSAGGEGFTTFAAGTNVVIGGIDVDALANYLEAYTAAHGPWAPPANPRITAF